MDEGGIMDKIGLNRQNEFYLYETQHKIYKLRYK